MILESAQRTARLLLDPELVSGRLTEREATAPRVIAAVSSPMPILRRPRLVATLGLKYGLIDGVGANLGRAPATRAAALGGDARGEPRFIVRVDEFPMAASSFVSHRSTLDAFLQFHQTVSSSDCHYLLAVVPELAESYLEPDAVGTRALSDAELDLLVALRKEGVVFAQHGTTHRTRHKSPHRRSEFSGLEPSTLADIVDKGRATLEAIGLNPQVLVPPFNRFDDGNWDVLAQRFPIIAGGPESVPILGALSGPVWRQGAVYVPCYPPLYGRASTMMAAVQRIIELQPGTWVPIVLHPSWEHEDNFRAVKRLVDVIGPRSCSWDDLLEAIGRSAAPGAGDTPAL